MASVKTSRTPATKATPPRTAEVEPEVLFRIHTAKRPETRAARVEKFVATLAKHEKVHP